jgi:hypothetical protein
MEFNFLAPVEDVAFYGIGPYTGSKSFKTLMLLRASLRGVQH